MSEPTEEARDGSPAEVEEMPSDEACEVAEEAAEVVESEESSDDGPTVEELQKSLDETHERLLRSLADFENFKKRSAREQVDSSRFAAAEPIKGFLLVVDNLELASSSDGSLEDLRRGVKLILSQMKKLLERFGVEEVAALGERFDPEVHDAIARFEDAEVSAQMVAEELQKGYLMNGRLLRPAMVKVAVPVESPNSEEEGE